MTWALTPLFLRFSGIIYHLIGFAYCTRDKIVYHLEGLYTVPEGEKKATTDAVITSRLACSSLQCLASDVLCVTNLSLIAAIGASNGWSDFTFSKSISLDPVSKCINILDLRFSSCKLESLNMTLAQLLILFDVCIIQKYRWLRLYYLHWSKSILLF